jgi:hypothetical protein
MSDFSERIARLTPAQLELLARRLRAQASATTTTPADKSIPRRADAAAPAPLSFAQQRLWFLDQLMPGNAFYNIPAAVRLTGALDPEALRRGFEEIVRRHESLRTTFDNAGDEPVQRIAPPARVELPVEDLAGLPGAESEERALLLAAEEARAPFDLHRGPLLRIRLLRLGERDHVVLLTMHHIISDGWSMNVLIRELVTLYETFASGATPPRAELSIQYADFAAWQREHLSGAALEAQLAYWRERLAGASGVLNLPTDYPRPAAQSFRGARRRLELSRELAEALGELSRREGVTLFMTLLAAFLALLNHFTGETDLLVGSPVAGRDRAELEGLIGFFANILVLRTDLAGDPDFRELLARVRETTLGAGEHQEMPLDKIVDAVQAERDLSRTPLFQVAFTLQHAPEEVFNVSGLTLKTLRVESGTAQFDLVLNMVEKGRDLSGTLEYSKDIFSADTAARLLKNLDALLGRIVAQPTARLSELRALLVESDKSQWDEKRKELEAASLGRLKKVRRKGFGAA